MLGSMLEQRLQMAQRIAERAKATASRAAASSQGTASSATAVEPVTREHGRRGVDLRQSLGGFAM